MGSVQKYWERYIEKLEKDRPFRMAVSDKELKRFNKEYGKTPHTKESIAAYKKKLES